MKLDAKAWERRRVVVLGGAGFIGSNLALRLAGLGASVTVLDGFVTGCGGHPENLEPACAPITIVRADLSTDVVPDVVPSADVVFDLLGDPAHARSVADPARDLRHNLIAQLSVFETLRRSSQQPLLVLASTRSVYGRPQVLPVSEDHPIAPPDPNGIHKFAAEQYAVLYGQLHELRIVRLRLTNVYGPRQGNTDPAHGVTGFLIGRLLRDEAVLLYAGGAFRRDWLAVDDAVDALLAAGEHPEAAGQVLNIGHDDPHSLREFMTIAQELLGRGELRDVPLPDEQRGIDVGDYWTDPTSAAEHLGWRAKTSLREGLSSTLEFYLGRPQGSRWPPALSPFSI